MLKLKVRMNLFPSCDLPTSLGRIDWIADVINNPENPSTKGYNIANLFSPKGLIVDESRFPLRAS